MYTELMHYSLCACIMLVDNKLIVRIFVSKRRKVNKYRKN